MTGGPRYLSTTAAAATALAAAAGVTACGSGGDSSVAPGAVAEAASLTDAAKGANVDVTATVSGGALGDRKLTFSGSGYEQLAKRSGRLSFDLSKIAQAAPGSGLDPAKAKMDAIFVNRTMYIRSPLFSKLPAGKTWLKVDLAKALKSKGINPSSFTQNDPTSYLRFLRGASGKVTRVGSERVRDVETTHYKATVDVTKAPGLDRASARRLVQLSGTSKIPEEVWIDAKHMVRRVRIVMKTKLPPGTAAAGETMTIDETVELFAFGPKPRVEPPHADQVFDGTGLAAQAPTGG